MSKGMTSEQRRGFLVRLLAAGMFSGTARPAGAQLLGAVPAELPPSKSFYAIEGRVSINGLPASGNTRVVAGDSVTTGERSQAIFVVGKDAFLLRAASEFLMDGNGVLVTTMRLVTGAVLSVFGKGAHRLDTPTASIGIRGTGIYVEARPEYSYVCTCYGITEISASGTGQSLTVESRHHDDPLYIYASGQDRIRPAPVINHTDAELMLLEALVGRKTPFGLVDDSYGGGQRY